VYVSAADGADDDLDTRSWFSMCPSSPTQVHSDDYDSEARMGADGGKKSGEVKA